MQWIQTCILNLRIQINASVGSAFIVVFDAQPATNKTVERGEWNSYMIIKIQYYI